MGPKEPCSTVLSKEEEAVIITFRKHTLVALDDCLYARQGTIPHLTRSSLHRSLQRHGICQLAAASASANREPNYTAFYGCEEKVQCARQKAVPLYRECLTVLRQSC